MHEAIMGMTDCTIVLRLLRCFDDKIGVIGRTVMSIELCSRMSQLASDATGGNGTRTWQWAHLGRQGTQPGFTVCFCGQKQPRRILQRSAATSGHVLIVCIC